MGAQPGWEGRAGQGGGGSMYSSFWTSARLKCVLRGTSWPWLELPQLTEVAHSWRSCEGGLFLLLNGCFCFRGACAGGPFPSLPLPSLTSQSEEEVWEGPETATSPICRRHPSVSASDRYLDILKPMKRKLMRRPKSLSNLGLRHKSLHLNPEEHLFHRTVTIIGENNRLRFVSRGPFWELRIKDGCRAESVSYN